MAVIRDESKPYVLVTVEIVFPEKKPPANRLLIGTIVGAEHLGWTELAIMVHDRVRLAHREMALELDRDPPDSASQALTPQAERRAKMNKTIGGQRLN